MARNKGELEKRVTRIELSRRPRHSARGPRWFMPTAWRNGIGRPSSGLPGTSQFTKSDTCRIILTKCLSIIYWMLRQLPAGRESWNGKHEEAKLQLLRPDTLIQALEKMLPSEQRTQGELLLVQLDDRPPGVTMGIRRCLSDPRHGRLTPIDIQNDLFEIRFGLENYTSNPLTSLHMTLK
jgi:hypothetical protein